MAPDKRSIRYLPPDQLFDSIGAFDLAYTVTRGEFSIDVPGVLDDMEWNQMDQLHRQHIHNTYQKNLRIALGRNFATSLTRWGRWPFLISVSDMRVDRGLYYQEMVLAGVIFIHNTITMREENEIVHLKIEWIIQSHWLFKFLHGILGRMFTKLNARLQVEDAVIRSQRYRLRKLGYRFRSDPPDFYTANLLTNNTLYPALPDNASLSLEGVGEALTTLKAGAVEFLVRREGGDVLIWPAACPHEGGELAKGKQDKDCRLQCPWHGLKFNAARLSAAQPEAQAYGFEYRLEREQVHICASS